MRRRQFIAGLGSAAALPVVAWAQQGQRTRRIGIHPLRARKQELSVNLGDDV